MGMFTNYQEIAHMYPTNNLVCRFPVDKSYTKICPVEASKPYEEYNAKGELVGYFWRYGETLNLEFNIDGEIVVEDSALILTVKGEVPSETEGALLLRAYNVVDMISWTCTNIVDGKFVWTPDSEFTYSDQGKSVYVSTEDYLKDKNVEVTLYNFRQEVIYTQIFEGTPKIILPITPELSKTLLRGIYYCSLTVYNDSVNLPIFTSSDCVLLVK